MKTTLVVKNKKTFVRPTIELVRLADAMPTLEEHIGLAHAVSSQFVNDNERNCVRDTEEFAEACIALHRAIENFDPALISIKGFASYAWQIMRNAILDLHKKRRRCLNLAQVDSSILEDTVECGSAIDFEFENFVQFLFQDHEDDTDVSRRDKQILKMAYLDEKKAVEIAKEMGISKQRVGQIINRAKETIQERHAADYDRFNEERKV